MGEGGEIAKFLKLAILGIKLANEQSEPPTLKPQLCMQFQYVYDIKFAILSSNENLSFPIQWIKFAYEIQYIE